MEDESEALRLFGDDDYRRVEKTTIEEETGETIEVSTVLLMIDHNFLGEGPPIIFETMVFGGEMDEACWRYSTEEAARDGHETIVEALNGDKAAIEALHYLGSQVLNLDQREDEDDDEDYE